MKRTMLVSLLVLALALVAGPAHAKKAQPPKITGGGWAENFNAGGSFPEMLTQFGFNAHATGEGVDGTHPVFGTDLTTYDARGQFQGKSVLASDPSVKLSQGHGEVVCIANLGPSGDVDGGGDEDNDVWEVRIAFDDDGTTVYGSLLVQDNGRTDYMDESFASPFSEECGEVTFFELEPVIRGNLKVHA